MKKKKTHDCARLVDIDISTHYLEDQRQIDKVKVQDLPGKDLSDMICIRDGKNHWFYHKNATKKINARLALIKEQKEKESVIKEKFWADMDLIEIKKEGIAQRRQRKGKNPRHEKDTLKYF